VHIVATQKANEAAKIYYNGVQQPVNGVTWDGTVKYSGAFFAIGTQKNFSSRSFKGEIDDVCVYDRAISSAEAYSLSQLPLVLIVSTDDDTICDNTSTNINLLNSQSSISYQLKKDGTNEGSPQLSAGGDLIFNTGNLTSTAQFAIHATDTITGCSILLDTTLTITVNNSNTGIDTQTACDSLVWIDGNTYYANNNTATHTLMNAVGCDSVVTLDLTVNYANTGIDTQTACDSLVWIDGNTYYANNNTATHTLTNVAGCDSVLTLDLTVNYANTGIDTQTACDSLVWIDGITYYANNNLATHTLTNAAGCDSVVTLDLTVNYATSESISPSACFTYTSPSGKIWNSSGSYLDTIANTSGCDSVISIGLTINTVDTAVTKTSSIMLIANATGAAYQWLDCNNAFAFLSGETSQAFTATVNGSYAVEVTENGCTDTSNCHTINGVGIQEQTNSNIYVYPNPARESFTIIGLEQGMEIRLMDMHGREVLQKIASEETALISLEGIAYGVYLVRVRSNNMLFQTKLIVARR
jgi:hypothetical protein